MYGFLIPISQHVGGGRGDVICARAALQIGPHVVDPPVVLAPMAGVTNYPFRAICREFGAPLCVSEMVLASTVCKPGTETSMKMSFGVDENPRSIQLYGVDPVSLSEATKRLVEEGRVDHIDLNFGCPMRKVTSKGGGAAICYKPRVLSRLVRSVTAAAGDVPVTAKFRLGIDSSLLTFLDAGRVCEAEGCVAVGLHARTADMLYAGQADWSRIEQLVNVVDIPVLGNGDIFHGSDAVEMMNQTGCAGVIIGRGCLGYPWLFRELRNAFNGDMSSCSPTFSEVRDVILHHFGLSVSWSETWSSEKHMIRSMRRQLKWYLRDYSVSKRHLQKLMRVESLADLADCLYEVDSIDIPPPKEGVERKAPSVQKEFYQKVTLPYGFLESKDDDQLPDRSAEGDSSCG